MSTATLKKIAYNINLQQVVCDVQLVVQGQVSVLNITIGDAELSALNPDWWLPECCVLAGDILGIPVVEEPVTPVQEG